MVRIAVLERMGKALPVAHRILFSNICIISNCSTLLDCVPTLGAAWEDHHQMLKQGRDQPSLVFLIIGVSQTSDP